MWDHYTAIIIYKITNTQTNMVYIGRTWNKLQTRWSSHLSCLKLEAHQSKLMQFEFIKYGEDAFKVEEIDRTYLRNHGILLEKFWIEKFKSNNVRFGYNSYKGQTPRIEPRSPEMEAAIRKMLMNEI